MAYYFIGALTILLFAAPISRAYRLKSSSEASEEAKAVVVPGDLLLGGLFPIHQQDQNGDCSGKIFLDGVLALEAFLHSLDLVNAVLNETLGFRLGVIALDSCSSDRVALFNALKFVIRDYLKQKGRRKGDSHNTGTDLLWSPVAAIMAQNETSTGDLDVIGVVGPMGSSVTMQVANLFSLFRMPQISYAATTSSLSNRRQYPYFLRTVPSDSNQARVLVEILRAWNWTYVIGAYEDTNYGVQGFHELEKAVESSDICFADRWKLDVDQVEPAEIRARLRKLAEGAKEARAFVMYMHTALFEMIIRAAIAEGLQNRFVWIGTDGWGNHIIPFDLSNAVEGAIVSLPIQKKFTSFSNYFYSLKPHSNERNVWFKEFWRAAFDCSSDENSECWQKGRIRGVVKNSRLGSLHNVRDAVFAFSTALQRMHEKACHGGRRGLCYRMGKWIGDPDRQVLLEYLRNATFQGIDGAEITFFDGHDGLPNYTILNYQKVGLKSGNDTEYEWVNIGAVKADLDAGQQDQFRFDHSRTNHRYLQARFKPHITPDFPSSICGRPCQSGQIRRHNQNKCCWSCERCPFPTYRVNESMCDLCPTLDLEGHTPMFFRPSASLDYCESLQPDYVHYFNNAVVSIVAVASSLGLLLALGTLGLFLYYAHTPIIKASGRELSLALLSGIVLCYSTVFVVAAAPNAFTCALSRFFYSTGYTICYGSIFIKTNRIARIFRPGNVYTSFRRSSYKQGAKRPSMPGSASSLKRMRYISPLSQVLFVIGLVGFQCVINTIWLILRPPTPAYKLRFDYENQKVTLYNFCRAFENEDMVIALLFPVTLLLFASFYAFKTRKCPGKFNEMKYIVITTYTTCIVWLAFIPVFFATEQLHLRIYAMCASLFINATVTLVCMFAPKLFVAIYRPQKNTKDAVMGKKDRTPSAPPSPAPYGTSTSQFENFPSSLQWNCPSTRSSMISAFGFDAGISADQNGTEDSISNRRPLLPRGGSMRTTPIDRRRQSCGIDHLTVPKPRYYSEQHEQGRSLLSIAPKTKVSNGACVHGDGVSEKNTGKGKSRRKSL